ncbi:hypothetical protein JCM10213v2_001668 [Rhodosporidiobolus nylandii]
MAPSKSTKSASNQRLKVVVRRLPPDLPAEVFWRSAAPWVSRADAEEGSGLEGVEAAAWSEYKPGKVRMSGKDKDSVHSRAYITFRTPDALVAFHRGYDGWSFRDKQGNVSQAVVEFAPYQRMPVVPSKQDPRQGTIDEVAEVPKTTPLLDHLRAQKAAAKAARKQALAALKKDKKQPVLPGATKAQLATAAAGGVQAAAPKSGKNGKEKKNGKGKKGSKEPSRTGTPAQGENGKGGKQSQGPSRTASTAPQTPQPPGQIHFPPGSLGAQQQAQRNATAQAQLVRQQLQQQHQRRTPQPQQQQQQQPGLVAPQPQILRNPARATPSPAAATPPPAQQQALGPGALAGAQIAAQAAQRRQVGAALTAALGEGTATRQAQQGQGRGGANGGGGRGRGGGGGRGGGRGRGRGRGGAANGGGAS